METKRALVQHRASGDRYIIEYDAAYGEDDEPEGTNIIASVGPLTGADLDLAGPIEPSAELFDRIDDAMNLTDEDAAWLQEQDDAGLLLFPIGVR